MAAEGVAFFDSHKVKFVLDEFEELHVCEVVKLLIEGQLNAALLESALIWLCYCFTAWNVFFRALPSWEPSFKV